MMDLSPQGICVAVHPALEYECPICGAFAQYPCVDEGEELPLFAAHIGRTSGGASVPVEHTGFTEDGEAILRAVDN